MVREVTRGTTERNRDESHLESDDKRGGGERASEREATRSKQPKRVIP